MPFLSPSGQSKNVSSTLAADGYTEFKVLQYPWHQIMQFKYEVVPGINFWPEAML